MECDGHDYDAIDSCLLKAKDLKDKPTIIIAHTVKGKGVSFMENNYAWHGSAPSKEQYEQAIKELEGKK